MKCIREAFFAISARIKSKGSTHITVSGVRARRKPGSKYVNIDVYIHIKVNEF